jgi:alkanesulfonate monooxygenase SsuD/methylene tetrahydromethanopterin reductase-like flavin-dependent oxidoreductase (luciferase family)
VVTDDAVGADDAGPLVGTPDQVAAGIEAYADAGATRVILRQRGLSTDERVAQLGRFAEDVRPLL